MKRRYDKPLTYAAYGVKGDKRKRSMIWRAGCANDRCGGVKSSVDECGMTWCDWYERESMA